MPVNVPLTNSNVEKISRHDLLNWVNETLSANYRKIEDLCSGIAYCQLMDVLFPDSVPIKKVKTDAKLEHEFIYNLRLFQSSFTKIELDKSVPINQLIKRRFQDNFEFLQWFKKFYDFNVPVPETEAGASVINKEANNNNLKTLKIASVRTIKPSVRIPANSRKNSTHKIPIASTSSGGVKDHSKSPSSFEVYSKELNTLKNDCETVEAERDFYFQRLSKIEGSRRKISQLAEGCNRQIEATIATITMPCDEHADLPEYAEIVKKLSALLYKTSDTAEDVPSEPNV